MKKTKAQASATKNNENNINGKTVKTSAETVPSDIRAKDSDGELDFKKVLYGYDPDEVKGYIDEMNKTYTAAVRNYESRLSSAKEELLLSNRERDSLSAKFKKMQSETAENVVIRADEKTDDNSEKYKEALLALQAKLEQIQAEKNLLEQQNSELKAANENAADVMQRYDSLNREFQNISAENSLLVAEISEKEKRCKLLSDELEQKKEKINVLSLEAENAKRVSVDFEIKNSVLAKQLEEKEEENLAIKEQNKKQAYDCAEKINKLESEYAQSRLALQKDMQLREYYINRAELTLAELAKQMVQIKQSFGEEEDG